MIIVRNKLKELAFVATLAVLSVAVANAQDNDPNATMAPTSADDDPVGLRLLFRYSGESARLAAAALALLGIIDFDISDYSLGAITVDSLDQLERLRALEGILQAEPDRKRDKPPNEGSTETSRHRRLEEEQPYGISMIQADQLWDIPPAGEVNVCIVDTGMDLGHDDLPTLLKDGVSGTNTIPSPILFGTWNRDEDGHGTHCAGIVGAIGDNDQGVVGVRKNPADFRFHIGKGLSNQGNGFTSSIIQAVNGCVRNKAKVISMSLGGPISSPIESAYYEFLYNRGYLIIAAAGNEGNKEHSYPASYPAVMSVAAVDSDKDWASFSQYNDQVEISAPGVDVLSTYPPNRYKSLSGTSMATPYVAGVAAQVWSHFPNCTNSQIRNVLIKSALDDGSTGYDTKYGHGIVQAKAAYDLLQAQGCQAGGAAVTMDGPVGGCLQHPEYVAANCTSSAGERRLTFSFGLTTLAMSLVCGASSIYLFAVI